MTERYEGKPRNTTSTNTYENTAGTRKKPSQLFYVLYCTAYHAVSASNRDSWTN